MPVNPTTPVRRADWRFLLPAPLSGAFRHLVLLGGPADLAQLLLDIGLARHISTELPVAGEADAVIRLADAVVTIESAARAVGPEGVLYAETDRRRRGSYGMTPQRLVGRLEGAGLAVTGRYWIVPHVARCRRFLPLDQPAALDWFLSTINPATSMGRAALLQALRWLAAGRTSRLARWVPCFGITAVRGRPRPPSVLGDVRLPAAVRAPDVRTVVLTSGQDDGSRVVLLPFAPEARDPMLVLKIARLPAFNGHTDREQATLRRVRAQLDEALRPTLPEPGGTLCYAGLTVGIESPAPGVALLVSSGSWSTPRRLALEDLRVASGWLTEFHRQARIGDRWTEVLALQMERRGAEYRERFAPAHDEDRLLALAADQARALIDTPLPLVWAHNDFGPWNIYRAGQRVTVIDWEFGGEDEVNRSGPALCDLIYFIAAWAAKVWRKRTREGELEAFRRVFAEPERGGTIAAAAHDALRGYMAALGIAPEFYPVLLVYTWLERALDRHDRQGVTGDRGPSARAGNQFVRYLEALARSTDRLFQRR